MAAQRSQTRRPNEIPQCAIAYPMFPPLLPIRSMTRHGLPRFPAAPPTSPHLQQRVFSASPVFLSGAPAAPPNITAFCRRLALVSFSHGRNGFSPTRYLLYRTVCKDSSIFERDETWIVRDLSSIRAVGFSNDVCCIMVASSVLITYHSTVLQ